LSPNIILPETTGGTSGSSLLITGSGQIIFESSSQIFKNDYGEILDKYLNFMNSLKPLTYYCIDANKRDIGLIAEEVEEKQNIYQVPNFWAHEVNGIKTVSYRKFIPLLIEKSKRQTIITQQANQRINDLENENKVLKDKIKSIEEHLGLV